MSKRLALVAVVVLTATACSSGRESDPASTPRTPASPSSNAAEPARTSTAARSSSSSPSTSASPSESTTSGATRGTDVAKPRVCYVPGKWTRYSCTQKEFERNKVAVRKKLPKGDKRCLNGQPPRFYCAEASGRVEPSGR